MNPTLHNTNLEVSNSVSGWISERGNFSVIEEWVIGNQARFIETNRDAMNKSKYWLCCDMIDVDMLRWLMFDQMQCHRDQRQWFARKPDQKSKGILKKNIISSSAREKEKLHV